MTARSPKTILVTGGAGFIGSNFIRFLFSREDFHGTVINADKLTYAGNPANLHDIEATHGGSRYRFEQVDICDRDRIAEILNRYAVDCIIHFAAESHVDRSILGPGAFVQTNIVGTFTLLEAARAEWKGRDDALFHHVSTDEVYGSLGSTGAFLESTAYDPRSPYSASKASSDHLVRAYYHTFGLPITVSNCSNNYGPYQFPEKLIPVMILNMLEGKNLPVYGKGENIRDWLYVEDHAVAIWNIACKSPAGETYNVGGENEWKNLDLVRSLCNVVASETQTDPEKYISLIKFVTDRPGHDQRYAIDCSKIKHDLGWSQLRSFEDGLTETVRWYLNNMDWVDSVRSGDYRKWMAENYENMKR